MVIRKNRLQQMRSTRRVRSGGV